MPELNSLKKSVKNLNNSGFDDLALEIFRFQFNNNQVYHDYVSSLHISETDVESVETIPFLPIEFFKNHEVKTSGFSPREVFRSSGTTGSILSQHLVEDISFYHENARVIFQRFFGDLNNYVILALLPSYLEREDSSLISMVSHFISQADDRSGFYLNNYDELVEKLKGINDKRIILWGVTFALLDIAEQFQLDLSNQIIIETGGMKGRRKEIVKNELYRILKDKMNEPEIWSEYGMTELLSQGYGKEGMIEMPATMQMRIREFNDPFSYVQEGNTGGINVIDLANVHSCSFIETKDIGRILNGKLEILGRFDNSDLRGCNLLVS